MSAAGALFASAFTEDGTLLFLKPAGEGPGAFSELWSTAADGTSVRVLGGGDNEAELSREEKLRRERTRQLSQGVTSFAIAGVDGSVIVPQGGSLLMQRVGGAGTAPEVLVDRAATGAAGPVLDAQARPTGGAVAFVQDCEVYVAPFPTAAGSKVSPVQVTYGARGVTGMSNGSPDYIVAEEFERQTGFWWSPDGAHIAFQETNDTHVPRLILPHPATGEPGAFEEQRYPFVGARNALVRIGVVDVNAALAAATAGKPAPSPIWLDLGADADIYVVRVAWLPVEAADAHVVHTVPSAAAAADAAASTAPAPRSRGLVVQLLNRAQTVLDVVRFDAVTGRGTLLLREVAPTCSGWVNVHDMLTLLPTHGAPARALWNGASSRMTASLAGHALLLWAHERSGFTALDLYAYPLGADNTAYAKAPTYTGPPRVAPPPPPSSPPAGSSINGGGDLTQAPLPLPPLAGGIVDVVAHVPLLHAHAHGEVGLAVRVAHLAGGTSNAIVEGVHHVGPIPGMTTASGYSEWEPPPRDTPSPGGASHSPPQVARLRRGSGSTGGGAGGPPSFAGGNLVAGVWFSGSLDGPLERHLYLVPLWHHDAPNSDAAFYGAASPGVRRLTSGAGMHCPLVSKDGRSFVDALSTLHVPPSLSLYRFDPDARFATSPFTKQQQHHHGGVIAVTHSPDAHAVMTSPMRSSPRTSTPFSARSVSGGGGSVTGGHHPPPHGGGSVLSATISCEVTGAYGPRIAAGCQLVSVLHGALPTCSGGTPPVWAEYKDQLHRSLGLLDSPSQHQRLVTIGGGGAADGGGADPLAFLNNAVDTISHSISSAVERLEKQLATGGGPGGGSTGGSPAPPSSAFPSLPSFSAMGDSLSAFGSSMSSAFVTAMPDIANAARAVVAAPPIMHAPVPPPTPSALSVVVSVDGGASHAASAAAAPAVASPAPVVTSMPTLPPTHSNSSSSNGNAPQAPLIVSLLAADGVTTLYASLYLPDASAHGPGPYPTVISVYGGPHVQRVKHDWSVTNEVRAQALRKEGFLVACCDNRGSARRGAAFEAYIHRAMGTVEVDDQCALVKSLVGWGLCDETRVGVYGWSYGGYLAALLLSRRPDVFHVAVSGAPVTEWESYDTGYTERYMGLPQENVSGYAQASVLTHVGGITGRLLLIHGLIDENVLVRNTYRLLSALTASNVQYDLILLPDERHAPRAPSTKLYVETRVRVFFERYLKNRRGGSSVV